MNTDIVVTHPQEQLLPTEKQCLKAGLPGDGEKDTFELVSFQHQALQHLLAPSTML